MTKRAIIRHTLFPDIISSFELRHWVFRHSSFVIGYFVIRHLAVYPPSTTSVVPVIHRPVSASRKAIAFATSTVEPNPSG